MSCDFCPKDTDGNSSNSQTLLKSFRKLKSKDIFDSSSLNSEIFVLKQLLQRNADQHHTRKYFRLSSQLSKKCTNLSIILQAYFNDFESLYFQLKDSCIHNSGCQEFLQKSKKMLEHISNIMSFSLKVLLELKRYLANCEFVKVLVALIAVVSKVYALVSQPHKNIKKIINLLSHDQPFISEEIDHSTSLVKDIDNNFPLESTMLSINEAEEDLGEVISDSEFKPNEDDIVSSLEVEPQNSMELVFSKSEIINVQCTVDETKLTSELKQKLHVQTETQDNKDSVHRSENREYNTLKNRNPAAKTSVALKRPTYKVYKQKHPFFRKLARYSSDLLRRDLPDYSVSLYLSL